MQIIQQNLNKEINVKVFQEKGGALFFVFSSQQFDYLQLARKTIALMSSKWFTNLDITQVTQVQPIEVKQNFSDA
jgi:hypothetical protein